MTRWLTAAVLDWLIIAAAFFAIWLYPWAAFVPAAILIGSRQHALVVLGHEGGHYLISRNKALNDFLTTSFGLSPMLLPLSGWRAFHNAHHRHLGDDNVDPEIEHKRHFTPAYDPPFTLWKLTWLALTDMLGRGMLEIPTLVRIVWRGGTISDGVRIGLWWTLFVGGCVWFHSLWIVVVWLFCYTMPTWAIFRLRTATEHPFLISTPRFKAPGIILRWLVFPHNVWMHWEHHRRPGMPFYRLPEVRKRFTAPAISDRLFT